MVFNNIRYIISTSIKDNIVAVTFITFKLETVNLFKVMAH